eukprot:CAMPEP_0198503478 /NCGR_PEP_ID=MMETSP1462-20131121/9920_1 /TAXON_ID=1333877 /ORGANISM="Brandtodinium nutriculum, Strain RCC3387" /LENGTH=822 /DNA_ID=CAMNT_0044232607 /DNA_START=29 /DNA_END=2497 /DNA_ORIENTATION=-
MLRPRRRAHSGEGAPLLSAAVPQRLFQQVDCQRQVARNNGDVYDALPIFVASLLFTWLGGPLFLFCAMAYIGAAWLNLCCLKLFVMFPIVFLLHCTGLSPDASLVCFAALCPACYMLFVLYGIRLKDRKDKEAQEAKEESPTAKNRANTFSLNATAIVDASAADLESRDQELYNSDGAPVRKGTFLFRTQYYCGRQLGTDEVPGSDGMCGPTGGPQCAACEALQEAIGEEPSFIVQVYTLFKTYKHLVVISVFLWLLFPFMDLLWENFRHDDMAKGSYASLFWICAAATFIFPISAMWKSIVAQNFTEAYSHDGVDRAPHPVPCDINCNFEVRHDDKAHSIIMHKSLDTCELRLSQPALLIGKDALSWQRAERICADGAAAEWRVAGTVRHDTEFSLLIFPDPSSEAGRDQHAVVQHFQVTRAKASTRVRLLLCKAKFVLVAGLRGFLILVFGLLHDLMPYVYFRVQGQGRPPCILPLPEHCSIPCINALGGYLGPDSEAVKAPAGFDSFTSNATVGEQVLHSWRDGGLSQLLAPIMWLSGDEIWCTVIPGLGLYASSLLLGILVASLMGVYSKVCEASQQFEDLNDLLLIYRWPAPTSHEEESNDHQDKRQALLTYKLARLRDSMPKSRMASFYSLDEYPLFVASDLPPAGSGIQSSQSLTWWFSTRAALMADLERHFVSHVPPLLAILCVLAILVAVTVYRGVTMGLEFPLTAYALLDGGVFGVLVLALVLSGSSVNDSISQGEELVQSIIDESTDEVQNGTMKALLDYYTRRPYRLRFLRLTLDRGVVGTYAGSLGAYGVVIIVSFFKTYMVPFVKELE